MLYDPTRLKTALDARVARAVVATRPTNVRYLTRFGKAGPQAAVLAADAPERPVLVAGAGHLEFVVEDLADGVDVRGHGSFVRDVAPDVELNDAERWILDLHERTRADQTRDDVIAAALEEHGIRRGTVVTDAHPDDLAGVAAALPNVDLVRDPTFFRGLRMIKTRIEVDRLAEVARVTELAIAATLAAAADGVTQAELSRAFRAALVPHDATLRQDSVSIGRSTAFGDAKVPDDVLEAGDLIRFDVGAVKAGYESDMSRCAVYRHAGPRMVAGHRALVAGQQAGLELLRPGVRAREVFDAAVSTVRSAGLSHYARTHVGHGIGLSGDGYDPPLLAPGDDTPLAAGMVLCVETPYYELGFGGLQVEDMIVVTDDGFRYLTTSRRDLQVVG